MQVQHVPLQYIHQTWPLVEKYLSDALEYSHGEYTPEQAKVLLSNGTWTLYVAVDGAGALHGACAVIFNNRPNDRVGFIVALGGDGILNPPVWAQLVEQLRCQGATAIEGACRGSVARLWARCGAVEKYRIVGVKL